MFDVDFDLLSCMIDFVIKKIFKIVFLRKDIYQTNLKSCFVVYREAMGL